MPVPSASGSAPPATTASSSGAPATVIRTSPARLSPPDRHRPAAYHGPKRARSRPKPARVRRNRSERQFQDCLQDERRPILLRIVDSGDRTEGGCALEGSYRAAVHGTAARVYQVRAAIPWRTMCLPPPRKTTNNVSNVANRTFTFSFEIRDHGHRERWPGHPMPLGSDAAAAPATALEVASPTGRSTRTVERQVMSADQPMVAHDAVPASRSAAARLLRSASRPVTVHSGPATAASWTGLIPVHAVRAVVLAHLRGYAERTNQVVHSAAGLQSSSEAYGLRCGMVRARQAAGASLLPLARVPAVRHRRRLPRAHGRGRQAAVRRHRRRRRPAARRRHRLGARRHRHRVGVPRQRAIARRRPGPDAS